MIFGSDNSKRIVRSWPGQGTGETVYETEDGRTWITPARVPVCDTTAPSTVLGTIRGGRIYRD